MTRKHYVMLANAIVESGNNLDESQNIAAQKQTLEFTALCIANALKRDNVRFDRYRFMEACGFKNYPIEA